MITKCKTPIEQFRKEREKQYAKEKHMREESIDYEEMKIKNKSLSAYM